jgi:hypothetical protein
MLFSFGKVAAQSIGINTTTPDASSILDIKATGSAVGLLIPRLTTLERNSFGSSITGLIIYNSTAHTLEVTTSSFVWKDVIYGTTNSASAGATISSGKFGLGTSNPDANAVLDITSTTKGVVLPMATADPTGVEGMIYYNTTTDQVKVYDGTSWIVLTY